MTAAQVKAQFDTQIRNKSGAGSITKNILADQLNALVDFVADSIAGPLLLLLNDTFTDADGVVLTAHTPESGGGVWTRIEGTGTDNAKISGNKLLGAQVGGSAFAYVHETGQANVKIQADFNLNPLFSNGVLGAIEIIARQTDANNFLRLSLNGNNMSINKVVAGVLTELSGNVAMSYPSTGLYPVEVNLNGSAISFTANGVTLNVSDAFNAGATKHGMRIYSADNTNLNTIDNFKVSKL